MIQVNGLLITFVALYIMQGLADLWLEQINLRHLQRCGTHVPDSLDPFIDAAKLSSIRSYTFAQNRLAVCQGVVTEVLLIGYILTGLMTQLQQSLEHWGLSFAPSGCLFFLVPGLSLYAVSLPFDYYRTFVIEEHFGFNRSTLRLWVIDLLKAGLLSVFILTSLLLGVLWLIEIDPILWWLWGFFIVSLVQISLTVLYPKLIAPLFNKFEPIKDEILAANIRQLMEKNGFRVRDVFQMNAGLRSRHTNAYFTGLGRTKQIVLFDTLIEAHAHDEILAILAHEVGHFRGKHIIKQIVLFELAMLAGFYLASLLLNWSPLYSTFGFSSLRPYAGLFVIGIFLQKAGFFLQPLYMALSRHFEKDADLFAARIMENPHPLAIALKRTAADNLSNLWPHPFYVWFNYSHPPLIERIEQLEKLATNADNQAGLFRSIQEWKSC